MREGAKTEFARALRRNMTDAERLLWSRLRAKQLSGHRFRRQHPIGPYIVDFVCLESRLIVEVDGGQHNGPQVDVDRDTGLKSAGFRVLRFWNNDVLSNAAGVCDAVVAALGPRLNPPPRAGRE
jgi:very-short-patch-repair endonuclease